MSVALLQKMTPEDLSRLQSPLFHSILKTAAQQSPKLATIVFNMIPPEDRDLIDVSRLIHSGIDLQESKTILRQAIQTLPAVDLNMVMLGSFLKLCSDDPELTSLLWAWSSVSRRKADEGDLCFVTVQYLMFCGKSGRLQEAQDVFKEAFTFGIGDRPHVIAAMLAVYSLLGEVTQTEALLSTIPLTAVDRPMLLSALATFSHARRPESAWNLLQKIKSVDEKKLVVTLPAYTAVVDSYARIGDFPSAMKVIEYAREGGVEPNFITWYAILSPCRRFQELSVALHAFEKIQQLDIPEENKIASYVLLADVHRACGDEDSARALHDQRLKKGLHKKPGSVDVTVDGIKSVFNVDRVPPQLANWSEQIDLKLDEWGQEVARHGASLESITCRHAEKLALAYAVLRGQKDITLRKNLKICDACHQAALIITVHEAITIRHLDGSRRIHIMENGVCSCGGHY